MGFREIFQYIKDFLYPPVLFLSLTYRTVGQKTQCTTKMLTPWAISDPLYTLFQCFTEGFTDDPLYHLPNGF